ncbi:Bug family tripartite tricarboxylate transporter substrate binding protein [Enterovirga rhinocerotis]|uniref:Tripartite-type tricarboxylate transporter receptor subunit TctC n=1 Tax=Enterovirga rhinocerotis TaxID=1339210 RepID=A0A4R7C824_9HYPH|nr:tripartite tricarboxylate transporter substrate binding protein [Enterovirga rhinocerotis]TDR93415.1 tripartite-type tricarboxylate transporter receptor subunit TctC [Enterovirga rhinocerotis]
MDDRKGVTRRVLAGGLVAGAAIPVFRGSANAQAAWPSQTVRIIVPYPPGGSTDVLTRILAERLKDRLGGTWVIENRPGAGGNIGIEGVVRSDPDGHTIGSATVGHFAINQYLYARMSWDPDKDFAPVSMTWDLPNVAVVPSDHVPVKTLAEFIDWAKKKDGGIFYGSPGVGTSPHLSGAMFTTRHGIKATHVPFRGASATIPAMLKGDVHFAIDNLTSYMSIIESGQMRALAITAASRWPSLPAIPTMAEAGTPDFVVTSWAAFVVPRKTPQAIIDKLSVALREISQEPSVKDRFDKVGARPLGSTPDEVTKKGVAERPMWQEMIKVSGARLE